MKGLTDVIVNNTRMAAGGTSGWHSHGPTMVSIKTGALTLYDGDDPSCAPTVYTAGTGFVDEGGGHVQSHATKGSVEAEWDTTYLVPRGAGTRVDADDLGNCSF